MGHHFQGEQQPSPNPESSSCLGQAIWLPLGISYMHHACCPLPRQGRLIHSCPMPGPVCLAWTGWWSPAKAALILQPWSIKMIFALQTLRGKSVRPRGHAQSGKLRWLLGDRMGQKKSALLQNYLQTSDLLWSFGILTRPMGNWPRPDFLNPCIKRSEWTGKLG